MSFCLLTISVAQAQTQKQKVNTSEVKVTGVTKAENYAEIKFDDVYGMSRDDILKFYATIEELNKILTEKI